ncbi:MAG: 16S rRNA processing protein RimM [Alphaproteobacteria bacterium]|nr:16S rRNA processing protein RimM [Alphaproteobacteria bacterium]MDE2336968.1 16S rRNA processing protein RimM [Alphaproteobacteria bacterium]
MHRKEAASANLVCMAEIVGVHGVRGMLKLKIFSDAPEKLAGYAPLCDAAGQPAFSFASLQPHGNIWLAALEGVGDRAAAEKLRGTKLYVPRDRLPQIADEHTYYHVDLIGLAVKDENGDTIGKIVAVANFGGGDLLDIKPQKDGKSKSASFYLPFTRANVPHVDLGKKEATVIIPPGLLD